MSDSDDFQFVTIGPEHGRNDGHSLPGFGERKQDVGSSTFKQNIRLDFGNTAGRIEQPANRVAGVQQQ